MNTSPGEEQFWERYNAWKEAPETFILSKNLLLVDWKSQKDRCMDHYYEKLTPSMLSVLICILKGRTKKYKVAVLNALKKRGLVTDNGDLTEHGRILAIRQLPLEQQCEYLNIPLENWDVPWEGKPEEFVRNTFVEGGVRAYFVENTFGLLIDYLMGSTTLAVAKRLGKKVYTLNPPYDVEIFFWVKKDLDKYLSIFDIDHCQTSFPICLPFLQTLIMDETPLQIVTLLDEMYRALGLSKIKSLIRMYYANPLAYNYRGWPDLFLNDTDNDSAYCVEVKTTDRLHINQLVTIPDLVQYTNIPIKVIRLRDRI